MISQWAYLHVHGSQTPFIMVNPDHVIFIMPVYGHADGQMTATKVFVPGDSFIVDLFIAEVAALLGCPMEPNPLEDLRHYNERI